MSLTITGLGQSGFRMEFGETVVYVDPYLTDYVAETYGLDLARLTPAPTAPESVTDARWVLITHDHEDHADPQTLRPLAAASPHARFVGPPSVIELLAKLGVSRNRLVPATEQWQPLDGAVDVRAVPAAHTAIERDDTGALKYVGYLLRVDGHVLYHAGDTIPHQEIFDALRTSGPIEYALLPINERNFFRDRRSIIGNMTVREAFLMASEAGVSVVVPIHWDLFGPNSTSKAEIDLLYRLMQPPFKLEYCEAGATRRLW